MGQAAPVRRGGTRGVGKRIIPGAQVIALRAPASTSCRRRPASTTCLRAAGDTADANVRSPDGVGTAGRSIIRAANIRHGAIGSTIMARTARVRVALKPSVADEVRHAVESGEYASPDEVAHAALLEWRLRRALSPADHDAICRLWDVGIASGSGRFEAPGSAT
jgi:antitoxin ParD1/3/4